MGVGDMEQMSADIGFFLEAKLTNGVCTQHSLRCDVLASDAMSPHKGGIPLIWRDRPNRSIESQQKIGINAISCKVVTGKQ